ncbi:MAG: metal-dependent transcriptional regulator [Methanomassiliicoccales archaeon]|jgi:DtxR family Mn-dependent transcriptional regulator
MPSEFVEEYLECIFELTEKTGIAKTSEIADAMKVSPASVTEMLQRLAADDFIEYERYKGAKLKPEGMDVARKIKRKHRLLERFLVDIVGQDKAESHEEACRLEHVVSDESVKAICQLTNNPKFCPDGEPIPECDEKECARCDTEPTVPLADLSEGDEGSIVCLRGTEPKGLRRLISMGFVPGRSVAVEERTPMGGPVLVRIGRTRIALATEYTEQVQVRPTSCRTRSKKKQLR